MALDERRQAFDVTRLRSAASVREVWFRGVHSDVGGGNGNLPRNNLSLHWILEQAQAAHLPLAPALVDLVGRDVHRLARISDNFDPKRNTRRPTHPGDAYHPSAVPADLAVGQSASFPVRAADRYNWSGVRLQKGARYRVEVQGDQRWTDGGITCDADGWTSDVLPLFRRDLVRHFERERRVADANWFALIAAVDDEETNLVKVGRRGELTAPRDGNLYAFANDLKTRYGNNEGQVIATVERVG
jgi:hypothetical protein